MLVAELESRSVGFCAVAGTGPERELDHLWVDPEAMGRGVGQALFRHLVEVMGAEGVSHLQILSDPHAEGFYGKMGAVKRQDIPSAIPGRTLPEMFYQVPIPNEIPIGGS